MASRDINTYLQPHRGGFGVKKLKLTKQEYETILAGIIGASGMYLVLYFSGACLWMIPTVLVQKIIIIVAAVIIAVKIAIESKKAWVVLQKEFNMKEKKAKQYDIKKDIRWFKWYVQNVDQSLVLLFRKE